MKVVARIFENNPGLPGAQRVLEGRLDQLTRLREKSALKSSPPAPDELWSSSAAARRGSENQKLLRWRREQNTIRSILDPVVENPNLHLGRTLRWAGTLKEGEQAQLLGRVQDPSTDAIEDVQFRISLNGKFPGVEVVQHERDSPLGFKADVVRRLTPSEVAKLIQRMQEGSRPKTDSEDLFLQKAAQWT